MQLLCYNTYSQIFIINFYQKIFLFNEIGKPCPKIIIYISINDANNILLFSATACFCPNIKIIKTYNNKPIITECNNIIIPFSILILFLKILFG